MDEMNEAGADWRLIVYGDAMRGFTHNVGPEVLGVETQPPPQMPLVCGDHRLPGRGLRHIIALSGALTRAVIADRNWP
jgi:hypothetical protein